MPGEHTRPTCPSTRQRASAKLPPSKLQLKVRGMATGAGGGGGCGGLQSGQGHHLDSLTPSEYSDASIQLPGFQQLAVRGDSSASGSGAVLSRG